MDLLNSFRDMGKYDDREDEFVPTKPPYPRAYTDQPINNVVEDFEKFNHSTMYYNLDGYISPHSYMNWGANSEIVTSLIEDCKVPAFLDRLDPNQIFTPDMAELRKLAADENKICKMFERRLIESLTAQGKIGLDELDIEAMQALTAARSSITSINKEKTNIKAKIADLKIKQQSLSNGSTGSGGGNGQNTSAQNPYAARTIMDNIFDLSMKASTPTTVNVPAQDIDPATFDTDDIGGDGDTTMTEFETFNPKTIVRVDPTGDISTAEYVTVDQNGNELTDFPNPRVPISEIDMNAKEAKNEIRQTFAVEVRNPDMIDIDNV